MAGFKFFQSMLSLRSSTLAFTPVPTIPVEVKMAPGSLKSLSVVHVLVAAATLGARNTETENAASSRMHVVATVRSLFLRALSSTAPFKWLLQN
jgi:hypothetical protein